MKIKNMFAKVKVNVAKMATILLGIYAVSITGLVVGAVTIGPLKDTVGLLAKTRTLEADLRESEKSKSGLMADRSRLLTVVKNLEDSAEVNKETIRALRKNIDKPNVEKNLAEANRMIEKLNKERSALMAKLTDLQKELQNIANARQPAGSQRPAPEMSELITRLEKEKSDLQARVQELQGKLQK